MADESVGARARRHEPWPWILAGLLAGMIVASLLLLLIAIRYPDAPIIDDDETGRAHAAALESPASVVERAASAAQATR